MYVRTLELQNFRNYQKLDLSIGPGWLLFIGENAQGKSNLLEAAYLLVTGRSVRASHDVEMIGWGAEVISQPYARVTAEVERRAGPIRLEGVVLGPPPAASTQAGRAGKRFRVNGIARRSVDLVGQMRAVLFMANDMEIVNGPPAERRQYLDMALSQVDRGYHLALQRYGRVLQQRNALLRRIKEGLNSIDELRFWDDSLAREGASIVAGRLVATERLREYAAAAHRGLSGAVHEELEIRYEPRLDEAWRGLLGVGSTSAEIESLLTAALTAGRRRDVAARATLTGPHRDDLGINLNGVSAAAFGSRAQIRTATLALRLAEARLLGDDINDSPVVLLDDVVSELDARRRESVLVGLAGFEQVWLTATDALSLPLDFAASAQSYEIKAGQAHPTSS